MINYTLIYDLQLIVIQGAKIILNMRESAHTPSQSFMTIAFSIEFAQPPTVGVGCNRKPIQFISALC